VGTIILQMCGKFAKWSSLVHGRAAEMVNAIQDLNSYAVCVVLLIRREQLPYNACTVVHNGPLKTLRTALHWVNLQLSGSKILTMNTREWRGPCCACSWECSSSRLHIFSLPNFFFRPLWRILSNKFLWTKLIMLLVFLSSKLLCRVVRFKAFSAV
jgi:hypothetical protein